MIFSNATRNETFKRFLEDHALGRAAFSHCSNKIALIIMLNIFPGRRFTITLAAACSMPFTALSAYAVEVPQEVHRKCKGAQDYSGCVRMNTSYSDRSTAPTSNNSPYPTNKRNSGLNERRSAPAQSKQQNPAFNERRSGPAAKQSPINSGPSSINLSNEKNITIESNKTNIMQGPTTGGQASESSRPRQTRLERNPSNKLENSRRNFDRTQREGNRGFGGNNSKQSRQSLRRK